MDNQYTLISEIERKVQQRRKSPMAFSKMEKEIIKDINRRTAKGNMDNISRTKYYASYFDRNREIQWSFLASMVSRNAGWNMTDLEGEWFPKIFTKDEREILFLTYERANWLIFSDAFPQLLVYEYSKLVGKPLFYLLQDFSVSKFIESEWEYYWETRDTQRLVLSQIINEQNIIQKPVIGHPILKKMVFRKFFYNLQDYLHFSSVVFPTLDGRLFGYSVHDFTKLDARIELGKKLASLLLHEKYFPLFYYFSKKVEHTGSRYDYERYLESRKFRNTPFLRTTYPVIKHRKGKIKDWYRGKMKKSWFQPAELGDQYEMTKWFLKKQKQLKAGILFEDLIKKNKD